MDADIRRFAGALQRFRCGVMIRGMRHGCGEITDTCVLRRGPVSTGNWQTGTRHQSRARQGRCPWLTNCRPVGASFDSPSIWMPSAPTGAAIHEPGAARAAVRQPPQARSRTPWQPGRTTPRNLTPAAPTQPTNLSHTRLISSSICVYATGEPCTGLTPTKAGGRVHYGNCGTET